MAKPKLLDLFCGAGGATKGYQEAGFYVVGIDINAQPRYCGDEFIQADVLDKLHHRLVDFDVIHASPPCQASSALRSVWKDRTWPELIPPVRTALKRSGVPYVIENVVGANLHNPVMLCGSAFDLEVRRHRLFESSVSLSGTQCNHAAQGYVVGVYGKTGAGANRGRPRAAGRKNDIAEWRRAMGIDWMSVAEISQAIPPAYTKYIGEQMRKELDF